MQIRTPPPRLAVPNDWKPPPPRGSQDVGTATPNLEDDSRLDLTRQRHFLTNHSGVEPQSEIDEAAIALIELSVLAYASLDAVGTAICKFPQAHLSLFGKKGIRTPDWDSLNWERAVRAIAWNSNPTIAKQPADRTDQAPAAIWSSEAVPLADLLRSAARNIPHGAEPGPSPAVPQPLPPLTLKGLPMGSSSSAKPPHPALSARRNKPAHALAIMHGDAALVSFRGTLGFADWGLDFCCAPTWRPFFRHWGFQRRWRMLRPQLDAWLEAQTQRLGYRPTLYLGGHSLGGAIASLAAADLASTYDIARVVTIGSPRPGGMPFRQQYVDSKAAATAMQEERQLNEVTTRFVHGWDVITLLPPRPLFCHLVDEIKLTAKDRVPTALFTAGVYGPTMINGSEGTTNATPYVLQSIPKINWRYVLMQGAFYLAMLVPGHWIYRLIFMQSPIIAEYLLRGGNHHRSALYLAYFPDTAIGKAMRASS